MEILKRKIVLVVDDEPVITRTLVTILNKLSNEFVAIGATSAAEALTLVRGVRPDLVLLDVVMPGVTQLEHAIEMRDRWNCKVLLLSGQPSTDGALQQLSQSGCAAFEILPKPIHPTALIEKIRQTLGVALSREPKRNGALGKGSAI